MKIPLLKLDPDLPTPSHAHPGDGGVDLYAREGMTIPAGDRRVISTGLAVAIPEGHAGLVVPRSGLAARHGIGVLNAPGLVDAGYRGEIKVVLHNTEKAALRISRGDRIAQLVVVAVADQEFVEVKELPASGRGPDGFGSTGR